MTAWISRQFYSDSRFCWLQIYYEADNKLICRTMQHLFLAKF